MLDAMARATLLYDVDCGFCRWTLGKVLAWDRRGVLAVAPIQGSTGDALLEGLDAEERLASWHLVIPPGERHSAGDAMAPLLRLLPGGRPFAAVVAAFPGVVRRAYAFVAAHRTAFGKPLRRGWIERADRRIEERAGPQSPRASSRGACAAPAREPAR